MADPIVVGELVDVPAPLSPINAQFHQEVANRIVHRFANVGAMNAWAAANGSLAFVIDTLYLRKGGAWVAMAPQSNVNASPIGLLSRAEASGTSSSIGTPVRVPGCWVTWTAQPGRWYRTTGVIPTLIMSIAGMGGIAIDSGSAAAVGVDLKWSYGQAAVVGLQIGLYVEIVESGLSGVQQRGLSHTGPGGGGTGSTLITPSTQRSTIYVEDLGDV